MEVAEGCRPQQVEAAEGGRSQQVEAGEGTRQSPSYLVSTGSIAGELANEPRTTDEYEGENKGMLIRNWIYEMAAYVRSLDDKHMVRTLLLPSE